MTSPGDILAVATRGHLYALPAGASLLIGRGAACDIVIDEPEVSREHCRIVASDDAAVLHDLGSRNGVGVNGRTVLGPTRLRVGDRIGVGGQTLVLTTAALGTRATRAVDLAGEATRELPTTGGALAVEMYVTGAEKLLARDRWAEAREALVEGTAALLEACAKGPVPGGVVRRLLALLQRPVPIADAGALRCCWLDVQRAVGRVIDDAEVDRILGDIEAGSPGLAAAAHRYVAHFDARPLTFTERRRLRRLVADLR